MRCGSNESRGTNGISSAEFGSPERTDRTFLRTASAKIEEENRFREIQKDPAMDDDGRALDERWHREDSRDGFYDEHRM